MGFFSNISERVNEARENRQERRESRRNRRKGRIKRRKMRRENRAQNREERIEFRKRKHAARLANRESRFMKRYKGFNQSEQDDMKTLLPYQDQMNQDLAEQGVQVDDQNDPIEVSTKWVKNNSDIADGIDNDAYNDAYINSEEDFDTAREYADRKGKGQAAMKAALGAVTGAVGAYSDYLQEKERSGAAMTDSEKGILDAKRSAEKDAKASTIGDAVMKYLPILVIVLVAYFVFFRKK